MGPCVSEMGAALARSHRRRLRSAFLATADQRNREVGFPLRANFQWLNSIRRKLTVVQKLNMSRAIRGRTKSGYPRCPTLRATPDGGETDIVNDIGMLPIRIPQIIVRVFPHPLLAIRSRPDFHTLRAQTTLRVMKNANPNVAL